METTLLWLLLVEALVLPHLLWVLSKRYRHALVYTWKVFILRDQDAKEEDTAACTLQSYRLSAKESNSRPIRNGIQSAQTNGNARGPDFSDSGGASAVSQPTSQTLSQSGDPSFYRGQRDTIMTTDLDDGMTVVTQLKTSRVYVIQDDTEPTYSNSGLGGPQLENGVKNKPPAPTPRSNTKGNGVQCKAPRVFVSEIDAAESITSSSTPTSPSKSTSSTPLKVPSEVKRSASASSRKEWKEKMRKKHLPAIFVNTSIDNDANGALEYAESEDGQANDNDTNNKYSDEFNENGRYTHNASSLLPKNASIESTYYVSSDYHYDNLANTLPPPLRQQATFESEGLSGMYDADDIDHILDNSVVDENAHTEIVDTRKSVGNSSQKSFDSIHHTCPPPLESRTTSSQRNVDMTPVNDKGEDDISKLNTPENMDSYSLAKERNNELESNAVIAQDVETYRQDSPEDSGNQIPSLIKSNSLDSKKSNIKLGNISRNNYRKFLSYSNLVVSSVDEVGEDENGPVIETSGETTDNATDSKVLKTHNKTKITSVSSTDTTHSQHAYFNEALDSTDDMADAEILNAQKNVPSVKPPVPSSNKDDHDVSAGENTALDLETETMNNVSGFTEHALQDYNQLETVSGTEMLHLKMKSVRSAMAVDYSDDTTSDEGGLDNDGFDDDTFDDEDANEQRDGNVAGGWYAQYSDSGDPKQSAEKQKADTVSDIKPDTLTMSGSENLPAATVSTQRDGNGDGRESAVEEMHVSVPNFSTQSTGDAKQADPDSKKELPLTFITESTSQTQESRQASYATNPFLRESFETLSQSPEYKSRFQAKKNPFFNSTDSTFGSVFSNSIDASYDLPTSPEIDTTHVQGSPSLSRSVSVDQTDSESIQPLKAVPKKPPKPPVPIMKPPRFRKDQEEKKSARHTSSEDELDSIFHDSNGVKNSSQSNGTPLSNSKAVPESSSSPRTNPFSLSPKINEEVETASNESDHSVVIEPYGQRRPAWLDEPLDSSSSGIILPDHGAAESDTDTLASSNTSSHFRYTVSDESPNNIVEYDFDSVNIGGFNDIGSRDLSRRQFNYRNSPTSQPLLVQYHFDEDTDRGFEDALAVDYLTHNNAYSGMGLCFESIKEEPEDNLSETASSFGGLGDPNVFKTHAVVSSRPSSRASVAGPPSETAPSPFEESYQAAFGDGIYFNQEDVGPKFPAFERTSADGSEGIPPSHNGNGVGSPFKSSADPWGFRKSDSISPSPLDQSLPNLNSHVKDIERADDLNTALAVTGHPNNSAWLGIEHNTNEPSLDMSFESDFSHQSGDNHLEPEKQAVVIQGKNRSTLHSDNNVDNSMIPSDLNNVSATNKLRSSVKPVYF